jgi:hypothetical protein
MCATLKGFCLISGGAACTTDGVGTEAGSQVVPREDSSDVV